MPNLSINRRVGRYPPTFERAIWTFPQKSAIAYLLFIVAIIVSLLTPGGQASANESRVLPQLQGDAAASPDKSFRVIVTRIRRDPQADAAVTSLGGTKTKDVNAESFVAMLPGRAITALGSHAAVKYVAPDAPMIKTGAVDGSQLVTNYPRVVQAAQLWSGTQPLTGAGVGVAVIDTGFGLGLKDWNDSNGRSRVVISAKFSSNTNSLADGHGHGTHIAGIIAGNSWQSSTAAVRGKYIGIAPEANLINIKVSDDSGVSYLSDVVHAIEWVIANRQTYNIRVINLSLISSVAESARTSVLAGAVERAWFSGIFVVVAAGNAGPNSMYYPPANDPFVVTVGATDSLNTLDPVDDLVAPWSSYGTTQDGYSKPDVVAPGRYIAAPVASFGTTLARTYPERIVDGSYIWMSGTSMSAPIMAGLAALAFQAHPEWTNDQIKWLIQNTALPIGGATPPVGQGAGLVNASAVVRYAGTPGFANQGITINELLVGPSGATTYTASSSASWSTASWSTATWSTASWSTANSSTASWGTAVEGGVE